MTNKGIYKINKVEIFHLVSAFNDAYRKYRHQYSRDENPQTREYFRTVTENLTPLFELLKEDSRAGIPNLPDEIIFIYR